MLPDLGVYITLYNDENFIIPCIKSVQKVFPNVKVLDLGSIDQSRKKAKTLAPVSLHLEALNPERYAEFKNNIACNHDYIFWIDGDEIYPETELLKIKNNYFKHPFLVGSWKMLRIENGKLQCSDKTFNKGRICWNTKEFYVGGIYPKEKLRSAGNFSTATKVNPHVFCYHALFLKRSSIEEDPIRKAKRLNREKAIINATSWSLLNKYPWEEQ